MRIKIVVICTCLFVMEHVQVFAQSKFGIDDYAKLVQISDPQISPDGKSVVVVVSRPDYINNRYNAELVLVDVATGNKTVLTQDRFTVSSPRWSPNGEKLAFISKAGTGKDALNQIFLLPLAGGEAKIGRAHV